MEEKEGGGLSKISNNECIDTFIHTYVLCATERINEWLRIAWIEVL